MIADSRATIVIVSNLGGEAELRALLRELLERQHIACEFSEVRSFDPNLLFTAPAHDRGVQTFVVLSERGARLYFRGPGGQRFLLRRLALPNGLDEVGRELVAQVVESSTRALLHSNEGLDRAQASREIEREIEREREREHEHEYAESRVLPSPATEPRSTPNRRAPSDDTKTRLTLSLGARYVASYAGSPGGLVHGPGLELGFTHHERWLLRWRASADLLFERTLELDGLVATEQGTALRSAVDFGGPLATGSPWRASLGLGGGVDIVRFVPKRSSGPEWSLASDSTSIVAVLRPELRLELLTPPFMLTLGAWLDVPLTDTHYDVIEGDSRRTIAAPWPIKPGALLGIGIQW